MERDRIEEGQFASWAQQLLDLFFVPKDRCPCCGQRCCGGVLCESCRSHLEWLCRWRDLEGGRHCYELLFYNNFLRAFYAAFKFEGASYRARACADLLYRGMPEDQFAQVRWLGFVPMHPRKKVMRGYNPVECMARHLSEQKGWQLWSGLVKVRDTKEQNKLDARRRYENVRHAYQCVIPPPKGAGIILDDFLTTGSTMKEILATFPAEVEVSGLVLGTSRFPENSRADE